MRYCFALLVLCLAGIASADSLALLNATIVDVRGLRMVSDRAVIIEEGRIRAIIPMSEWQAGPDLVRVDLAGKYLIPGLIDAHVHHATDPEKEDRERLTLSRLRSLLRGGVTSVRDMGGDVRTLASLKRRAGIDAITSPDIYYSVILGGPGFFKDQRTVTSAKGRTPGETDWMRAIDGSTDYDAVVLRAQGTGASGLKVYAGVNPAQLGEIAAAAKRHDMRLWSHAYHAGARPAQVSASGVEVMSHAAYLAAEVIDGYHSWHRSKTLVPQDLLADSFEEARYEALFDEMKRNGTLLDTTLTVFELTREAGNGRDKMYEHAVMFTRMAHERGIKLVAGTDAVSDISGLPFPAVHYEMQLLVRDAGLTPLQALQAATLHGAQAIGIQGDRGTLEAGNVADIVVLEKNPAENIEHTLAISHVLKNGRFVYRGSDPRLPFSSVREGRGNFWLSGQIGNFPGTMSLAGDTIESQTRQAMHNIGRVLEDYDLDFDDVLKCTLMLADIAEWAAASEVYKSFFSPPLPARSAFAASGLALGAKVEIECVAQP